MPRPKNPYGDPVRVRLHCGSYRVRYYPTGLITEDHDRKDLPYKYASREVAEVAAAVLREKLIAHRDVWSTVGVRHQVPLLDAVTRFLENLREKRDTRMMPGGTASSRLSDANLYLLPLARSTGTTIGDLEETGLARQIINDIDNATKANGTPKADNTRKRARASMRLFGKWLVSEGFVASDPFGFLDLETEETKETKRTRVRVKALESVDNDVYLDDGDSDTGIGLEDVPSLGVVSQLRDAIYAVETQTDPIEIFPLPPQDPMFLRCEDEVDDDEPRFTPYKNAVEDFPTEQGIHAEVSEELQDLLDKYDTFYDDEDHAKDLQSAHIALVESLFKCIVTAYDHPDTGMELKFSIGFGIDKYPDDVKMDVLQNYKVELMSNFYTRDHNYLNCFFEYVVNDLLEASAEARDDQMRNYIRTNPEAMEAIKTKLVARLINQ